MPVICPTITAETAEEYQRQANLIGKFASRIHIDLMDGEFTPNKSVDPADVWWPAGLNADLHIMFKNPLAAVQDVVKHHPSLVIIQAEAEGDFNEVHQLCRHHNIKIGLALLPSTDPAVIKAVLGKIDHVMIFSGNLGYQGGSNANLELLDKVKYLKKQNPELEIGWDGGVSDRNVSELVFGGIDVLNVGGFIQKANDPTKAYATLFRIADETGTT